MERVLLWLGVIALVAGCQSQNPFAAFGPQTVPSPTTTQTLPYYPPTATAPQRVTPGSSAANQRQSVSAEGTSISAQPRASFTADPADRDPIRVVENPAAAARTAAAPARMVPPTNTPATPAAPPAGGAAPVNSSRGALPSGLPQSSYAPSDRLPALNRTRGYISGQPATSSSVGAPRIDPAVVPAGYQQAAPSFVETPLAPGQWRAR